MRGYAHKNAGAKNSGQNLHARQEAAGLFPWGSGTPMQR